MHELLDNAQLLSSDCLLDPEQFETVDYSRQDRGGLAKHNNGDTLSPWQVSQRRPEHRIELSKLERLDRPSMAETDRTGRFRSIFDIESLKNLAQKPLKNITSRVDTRWTGGWHTLDRQQAKPDKEQKPRRKISLPKPLKAQVFQLQTEQLLPMPVSNNKFRSPTKLSSKRHLVQHINYHEIEESMFRKPMTTNRFDLLCRKLEAKMTDHHTTPEKIRVINFPVNEGKETESKQPNSISPSKDRQPCTTARQHRMRHTFTNTFYLRSKISKQRRQADSALDCVQSQERPIDFREILSDQNQKKIIEAKKRKSRIFSMVLRI